MKENDIFLKHEVGIFKLGVLKLIENSHSLFFPDLVLYFSV